MQPTATTRTFRRDRPGHDDNDDDNDYNDDCDQDLVSMARQKAMSGVCQSPEAGGRPGRGQCGPREVSDDHSDNDSDDDNDFITAGSVRQEPGLCVSRGGDQCEGRAAEAGGDQRDPVPHLPRLHGH